MWWVIIAAAASVLRLRLNDLQDFSRADETTYLRQILDRRSLRERLQEAVFNVPPPYRIGWTWLGRLFRVKSHRGIANLSTAFSIATVWLVCLMARPEHRTIVALLASSSPIALAMGRRALQDSAVGCMIVLCFLCADHQWFWPAIASAVVLASFKEVALVTAAPGLFALWMMRGGTWFDGILLLLLPPFLFGSLLLVVVRDFGLLWRTAMETTTKQDDCPYARAFGHGPIHTYLAQWFLISPVVAIAAIGGKEWWALKGGIIIYAIALCLPRIKNFRMFVGADALLRIVAGAALMSWPYGYAVAALNVALELATFGNLFLKAKIYDPVFANIVAVLGMIPTE